MIPCSFLLNQQSPPAWFFHTVFSYFCLNINSPHLGAVWKFLRQEAVEIKSHHKLHILLQWVMLKLLTKAHVSPETGGNPKVWDNQSSRGWLPTKPLLISKKPSEPFVQKFGTWGLNMALEYLLHRETIVCTTKKPVMQGGAGRSPSFP